MAIITVSGKQIDLQVREIKFQDDETGLIRIVNPKGIYINLENNLISYELKTKLVTPTGYEINADSESTYQLNIALKEVLSDGFNKPFINDLFREALKVYGIQAKQIFDETGKLNIIE